MNKRFTRTALTVILALVAFAGGYTAGHRTTFAWTMGMLSTETQGNLHHRIETLARLRTGDTDGAIALLEQAVDSAAGSLGQGKPYPELDPDIRFALQLARAYRDVYPAANADPELAAFLATVPPPDVRYCSPALQSLLQKPPK